MKYIEVALTLVNLALIIVCIFQLYDQFITISKLVERLRNWEMKRNSW